MRFFLKKKFLISGICYDYFIIDAFSTFFLMADCNIYFSWIHMII